MPIHFSQRVRRRTIRASLVLAGLLQWFAPAASAQGPHEGIQKLLGDLEAALSTRKVDKVSPLYLEMTTPQRNALQKYFDESEELEVHLNNREISVAGDTARAAFLREDVLTSRDGERTPLQVHLVADLVWSNGNWKIRKLGKP